MLILYVNPNINHHKLPFFRELQTLYGSENVIYAAPEVKEEWRNKMGFSAVTGGDWLFHITQDSFQDFERLFERADVVLCSVRDYWKLIEARLKSDKLTFYFSERWFKEPIGKLRLLYPPIFSLVKNFRRLSRYGKFFFLAQGQTAAKDFFSCGIGRGKTFSFGYFPPLSIDVDKECQIRLPEEKINILWCGRMIRQKRVDLLAKAFASLAKKHPDIHLTIIGEGPEAKNIKRILSQQCEAERYSLYGFVPNETIRCVMRQADIYVLTSSGIEGWGAVINEAMAESCAVVGGDRIGAVTSMFDARFGLKFESENLESLTETLDRLISNPKLIDDQKKAGFEIITTIWSPKQAASRFANVVSAIMNKQDMDIYPSGPFSLIK